MIESLHCFDNIIPLGDHCGPSIILKRLKIRKESYPFDWISHIHPVNNSILSIIIDIIKDENKYLLIIFFSKKTKKAIKKIKRISFLPITSEFIIG